MAVRYSGSQISILYEKEILNYISFVIYSSICYNGEIKAKGRQKLTKLPITQFYEFSRISVESHLNLNLDSRCLIFGSEKNLAAKFSNFQAKFRFFKIFKVENIVLCIKSTINLKEVLNVFLGQKRLVHILSPNISMSPLRSPL